MPLIDTPDGHYTHAITTANEGDGNDVVYDNWIVPGKQTPVWDKFSYEAAHRAPVVGWVPPPAPVRPSPVAPPVVGDGRLPIKVTDASDGELINRGYSYWSQAWIDEGAIYAFVGHADGHPRFFKVDLSSGAVERLGVKIQHYAGSGEGWYWDAQGWIYLPDGPRLMRVHPWTLEQQIVFSIEDSHPDCRLLQSHSSDDGQTHSATVQRIVDEGPYPNLGTVVSQRGAQTFFPAMGDLDESQITPDGGWVIIKEKREGLLCNRIIDLSSRVTRTLLNSTGAVGHSDCGPGVLVGEWSPQNNEDVGQCVEWDLLSGKRRRLFATWGMGHLSLRAGRCLLSGSQSLSLVPLEGGPPVHLIDHGMTIPPGTPEWQQYDYQVFANLSPCSRVACYLSNAEGRMDLYLLVLP